MKAPWTIRVLCLYIIALFFSCVAVLVLGPQSETAKWILLISLAPIGIAFSIAVLAAIVTVGIVGITGEDLETLWERIRCR